MASVFEKVRFISEEYGFCEQRQANGFIRVEEISGHTLVDGERGREMFYNRFSYAEAASGEFQVLFELPFGYADVSGA